MNQKGFFCFMCADEGTSLVTKLRFVLGINFSSLHLRVIKKAR